MRYSKLEEHEIIFPGFTITWEQTRQFFKISPNYKIPKEYTGYKFDCTAGEKEIDREYGWCRAIRDIPQETRFTGKSCLYALKPDGTRDYPTNIPAPEIIICLRVPESLIESAIRATIPSFDTSVALFSEDIFESTIGTQLKDYLTGKKRLPANYQGEFWVVGRMPNTQVSLKPGTRICFGAFGEGETIILPDPAVLRGKSNGGTATGTQPNIPKQDLPPEIIDAYAILGLDINADRTIALKRYRSLALATHPDRNPHLSDGENQFRDIDNAWRMIKMYHAWN